MRSAPEVGMPVVLKMDENSEKMPRRMVITNVLDKDNVTVAGFSDDGRLQEGKLPTACLEKYSKKRYKDGI